MGFNIGGLLKGALGAIPGAGPLISAGLGLISGSKQQNKANQQGQSALDIGTRRRTETAPLRSRALEMATQGLQTPREDLSSIFADAGNPYARVAPRPTAVPMAAPPQQLRPPAIGGGTQNLRGILRKALT